MLDLNEARACARQGERGRCCRCNCKPPTPAVACLAGIVFTSRGLLLRTGTLGLPWRARRGLPRDAPAEAALPDDVVVGGGASNGKLRGILSTAGGLMLL